MPDDDLTFGALCKTVGLAPNTVKRRLTELRISPSRMLGSVKLYSRDTAKRVAERHRSHGGRWPSQVVRAQ